MYRLEYNLTDAHGEVRRESIVIDKNFVMLADDETVDVALAEGTPGRFSIEEAKNGQVTLKEVDGEGTLLVNGQSVHASELRDEDLVTIGDVDFTYFHIQPPTAIVGRKSSPMQHVSTVSVGILVFAQILFLVWVLIFWRIGQTPLIADESAPSPIAVAQGEPSSRAQSTPAPVIEPPPTIAPTPADPPVIAGDPPPPAPVPEPARTTPTPVAIPKVGEVISPGPEPTPPAVITRPETPTPPVTSPTTPGLEPAPAIVAPELRTVPTPKPDRPAFPKLADLIPDTEKPTPPEIGTPETMLLRSAHDQIEKGNLRRADDYYKLLQRSNPSYLPVYSDRARLFEKRGMLKEAIDQWAQLKSVSGEDTLWSTLAQKQLNRLQERLRALEASYSVQSDSIASPVLASKAAAPIEMTPASTTPSTPVAPQQFLEIRTAEAPQMGSGDNYAYMRILSIELATRGNAQALKGEDILVRVQFYDQDRLTRRIYPSEVYVPRTEFTLSGTLTPGKVHSITCPYTVPIDFRKKQLARSKKNLSYYGFTVELFYVKHLQDHVAKPLSLASRIKK